MLSDFFKSVFLKLQRWPQLNRVLYGYVWLQIWHRNLNQEFTTLCTVFIDNSELAFDSSFDHDLSEWDADGPDIVSLAFHGHIDWLVNQIDHKHLRLHILQELGRRFNLELLVWLEIRVATLHSVRSILESIKIIWEKRHHSLILEWTLHLKVWCWFHQNWN